MSAGVCGKRVGFEEFFGSSPSAKRSRWSTFGSSELGSGSEGNPVLDLLLQMFPALDPELVSTIVGNHNNMVDDAVESLRQISSSNVVESNQSECSGSSTVGNCDAVLALSTAPCFCISEKTSGDFDNTKVGSKWVDVFVEEMMKAVDLDDARERAAKILEAFEQNMHSHSRASEELEHASLKQHLQSLLNDNQILKRAVAVQHERILEQEEKMREAQSLKLVLNQCHEQIRGLELSNYSLRLHLQRAYQSSSLPGQFHPDIH
uniref:CUE domain-containing protein n=1 Tax=Rhizophora mucronata TaxID=61149 RepID=A0A2P2JNY6_RHIMU